MSNEVRRSLRPKLLQLVEKYPGLHYRELARQLETSVALIEYHVELLVADGDLKVVADQRFQRVYLPTDDDQITDEDRDALHVLRTSKALSIALTLLQENEPMLHRDLVLRLGLSKATMSFHLRKMEGANLVMNTDAGYVLVDSVRTQALLRRHKPTGELRRRFARMWSDFYNQE